ncbi:MAG: NAD(P)/FAD-dependent oxidoreductase [Ilumatobacteraceae bacterium]
MTRRAIVVGAGLAGLTTADLLVAGGWEVVVLEATGRVGGRTFTRSDPFAHGQHAEAGAEWVDTVHHRIHGLIDRFGLEVDDQRTTWTAVRRWLFRSGRLLGPADMDRVDPQLGVDLDRFEDRIAEISAGIGLASHPELHPEAARYDALSVADLIEELQLGTLARLFAQRNMEGEFASEPAEVSLLFIAQQRKVYAECDSEHGAVEAQRMAGGGVSSISMALAAELPPATIRLNEPISTVEVLPHGGVRVETAAGVHEADVVVLATSLHGLREVEFLPPLSGELDAAIHGLGYGTVTKTALQYPSRPWPGGYATTEGRAQRVYEPTASTAGPGGAGILMAYTGGDGGRNLAALSEPDRMAAMESSEREMYPDLPSSIGGFSQAWSRESFFGGSYAVYRPGEITRFWRVLREQHGVIHLAGEHTATWTGYLEGAVESGELVAARLLDTD